jgi:hypothetical protein
MNAVSTSLRIRPIDPWVPPAVQRQLHLLHPSRLMLTRSPSLSTQVFVVDAADAPRVEEAKSAFVKASGARDLKGAPILVLANKHDTLLQMGTGEGSGPGGPGPVGLHGGLP